MDNKNNFIFELENSIIPSIRVMVNKEKQHLSKLKKYSGYPDVSEMIKRSEFMLNHFETRLIEYEEYLNKLKES